MLGTKQTVEWHFTGWDLNVTHSHVIVILCIIPCQVTISSINYISHISHPLLWLYKYQCNFQSVSQFHLVHQQAQIQGNPGARAPLDPRFWGSRIEHFWDLFHFFIIFFASLCSAYYFFNMLLFHSSNWTIFQPRFAQHVISHLEVLVSHILGY